LKNLASVVTGKLYR